MGRLATKITATVTGTGDRLPTNGLPSVSFLDALLPRSWSVASSNKKQPLDPNVQALQPNVYTDVKKDKNGKMVLVRHQSRNDSVVQNDENAAPQRGKRGKSENAQGGNQNGGGEAERSGAEFTADEDAKLRELKESNTSWKDIAVQTGRAQKELKARWKEIENKPGGNQNGAENKGAGGQFANAGGNGEQKEGDFSDEEIQKMKELLASNTNFKKISQELGRKNDKHLKDQLNKLKAEIAEEPQNSGQAGDAGFDAKDDERIKELLQSGKDYKQIAKALGRPLDAALKDEITKLKAMDGEGEKEKGAQKNKKETRDGKEKRAKGGDRHKKKSKDTVQADRPVSKARSVVSQTRSHRSEARFTMQEWRALQEDEIFNLAELQLLAELIVKNGDQSWLNIASRFHDKTGRRVHPDDIRDKMDQMGQMGKR